MSDQHWYKAIQTVEYMAQDAGYDPEDVDSRIKLMNSNKAMLLDEEQCDAYIEQKAKDQEIAKLEARIATLQR